MMKHEFEAIAGYEVSFEDYENIIEPMYMSTNLDKYEFIKCLDRKRFEVKAQESEETKRIKREAKAEIESLKSLIKGYKSDIEWCKAYYKEDGDKAWKVNIKNYQMYIQTMKNRIDELRFVIG